MSEMSKIEKILEIIFTYNKKGYIKWENRLVTVEEANDKIISFIKYLNKTLIDIKDNHKIMIEIEKTENKSLEDQNIIRWWGETMDFPGFAKRTNMNKKEVFELHTKVVFPQTILLIISLMIAKLK